MNKTTRGAAAAVAAGVLLLGGAGSLAYWNDTGTVDGGTINSGVLTIDPVAPCGAWTLDTAGGPTTFNILTDTIVPGDTLTKVCTFDIAASGNHLTAGLAVSGGTATGALASVLTTSATYKVGTELITLPATITSADNNKVLEAKITVTFPYGGPVSAPNPATGANNTTQSLSAVLGDITINATQMHG